MRKCNEFCIEFVADDVAGNVFTVCAVGKGEGPQIGVGILASVKDALPLRVSDDDVMLRE